MSGDRPTGCRTPAPLDPKPVLRVAGRDFDVSSFLARFPALQPDVCWSRGTPRGSHGTNKTSGFNLTLCREKRGYVTPDDVASELHLFAPVIAELASLGATPMVDFAVMVGGGFYSRSIGFSPAFLSTLGNMGVELGVASYLRSGEEDG